MKLADLRKKIDAIDEKILSNLAGRMSLAKKIMKLKVESNLPIIDKKREREVFKKRLEIGKKLGVPNLFIKRLFRLIIEESKRMQESI